MQDVQYPGGEERSTKGSALTVPQQTAVTQVTPDTYAAYEGARASQVAGGDLAVTLRQYAFMVLKRRWLISGVALASLVLGGVSALLETPYYKASIRIQIEREPAKIIEQGTTTPIETAGNADFLKTQYELLKSRSMAERVVSALRIAEDDGFFKQRHSAFSALTEIFGSRIDPTPPVLQGRAAKIVHDTVTITPVPGSRLVDLSFLDPSPERAQQIANGYADAYVASNLDKRFEANSYAKTFLDDQIKQLKVRLEDSEKTLLEFAEQEKIIEVTDKTSISENNLAAANAALGQLISERIKNEQSWRQMENVTAINLPQILSNQAIEVLRGQRKAFETEYQEKLESFKPSYPIMVQISNKIREIDKQLAAEIKTIRTSLQAAYDSSLAEENEMKERIASLRTEVLELQKKGVQYNMLKREAETNRGLYNSLLQRYKEVGIAGGVGANNIFVVDRAILPSAPYEPNIPRVLLLSLVFGFGAGVGVALLLELLDDSVRAPEDMEQLSGLATLGVIPRFEAGDTLGNLSDPRSAVAEAYRSLATALQFSTETGLPRSIVLTSAGPGEGKSTTAVAISRHFAQMGLKVLLVDADLRKPSLHTKLGLTGAMGLSNYLTGSATPPEVFQQTELSNLVVMASGPLPPNAADLLSGTRVPSLISVASEVFDLVVFDAPPLLGLADAQLLASVSEVTVFVVGAGERRKGQIVRTLRRLHLGRVALIGAVLTKFDAQSVGYTYGYGYSQSYGYGDGYGYGSEKARLAEPERS
jgi:capsular exopolysaccharide synthesis family protein